MRELKKKVGRIELRVSLDLLEEAKEKAKEAEIPLSRVLRRLLELWVEGKTKLQDD